MEINQEFLRLLELLNLYNVGDLVSAIEIKETAKNLTDKTEGETKELLERISSYFTTLIKEGPTDKTEAEIKSFRDLLLQHLKPTEGEKTESTNTEQPSETGESEEEEIITIGQDEVEVLVTFLNESLEHLQGIEEKILKLESEFDIELVNSIFRPVHSIKGSSGYFGFKKIKALSHILENLLDELRDEKIEADSDLIDLLLESTDTLNRMIEKLHTDVTHATEKSEGESIIIREPEENVDALIDRIKKFTEEAKTEQQKTKQTEEIVWEIENLREDLKQNFIEEAYDHFDHIESILLAMEEEGGGIDKYDDLFRSLHSLKGNSRLLLSTLNLTEEENKNHILNYFQEISHLAEAIIHYRRDTQSPLTEEEHDILLDTVDTLKAVTRYIETGEREDITPKELIAALKETYDKREASTVKGGETTSKPEKSTQISTTTAGDARALSFSNTMTQSIQMVKIAIENLRAGVNKERSLEMLNRAFQNMKKLGKSVSHNLLIEECDRGLSAVKELSGKSGDEETKLINRIENVMNTIAEKGDRRQAATVKEAIKKITAKEEVKPSTQFIKVSENQLNNLMNLVMELVVIKNNFIEVTKDIKSASSIDTLKEDIKTISQNIGKVTYDLQNSVMQMRMVPVGTIFSRFPRLVRDLSKAMNKKIRLEIHGEDTKLDKTIIDALADPLVHIIRNSVDHGISTPQERIKNGKPEIGTITLSAYNMGQNVVIEVKDDGRGIDPEKIKKKALEKGLVDEEKIKNYSEKDLFNLIFLPGFSTAEKVTDVSGRGVGMDVVKTNIEKLSGSIELDSIVGVGTTIRLKLPLTLAITKGLEITISDDNYYIPIDYVLESVKIPFKNVKKYRDMRIVFIRGEILPLYSLKEILGYGNEEDDFTDKERIINIVVLIVKGKKIALWVDEFTRESEFVIKPIPPTVGNIESFSGLTITGRGKIILVIDPLKIF